MAVKTAYGEWAVAYDDQGVAWVTFDKPGSKVNTLDSASLTNLAAVLSDLSTARIKALVLQSGKESSFIAGADIQLFKQARDNAAGIQAILEQGQQVFRQLEQAPYFTLAVIEGACMGGGLELALACQARIAVKQEKTRLSLPEVSLGVIPGWGGSVRLARRIGCWQALNMIVSGKPVDAKRAVQMGLVNLMVERRHVRSAIEALIRTQPRLPSSLFWRVVWRFSAVRAMVLSVMQQILSKKINPAHYPAPFQVIQNWKKNNVLQGQQGYRDEITGFMRLVNTETTQNLVRVFFLQQGLKSLPDKHAPAPLRVHVVGAGRMGGDIAAWLALQPDYCVSISDENPDRLTMALQEAQHGFARKITDPYALRATRDRLMPLPMDIGVSKADLVIEAVIEDLAIKQALLRSIEPNVKPEAVIATNTSTIPLELLASVLHHPRRLLGLHFFNPVFVMPLVEVIASEHTPSTLVETAMGWVKSWGKLPIPVKSAPGFLVNRILLPYLLESITMVEEGFSVETIDHMVLMAGFPMGPFTLMDTIGLDVCASVATHLLPNQSLPALLKRLVSTGALGKKTQHGFYAYHRGAPVLKKHPVCLAPPELLDRLWVRLWVAARQVLQEGVVSTHDTVDAGLLFGAGFPPFQGGLLHYIHQHEDTFTKKQADLVARYGHRFAFLDQKIP